jgi:hypothetical protein
VDRDAQRIGTRWTIAPPVLIAFLAAGLFAALQPDVPDLEAALARAAAASHGVGLTYWFQWFGGGTTPAQYSLLVPSLSALLGAPVAGAVATVAITPLLARVTAGSRNRVLATWTGTLVFGLNLWSGRIAFAVGAACAVLVVICVRERRAVLGPLAVLATVACSPVAAVFVAMALCAGVVTRRPTDRLAAALLAECAVALLAVATWFGTPGPEIYRPGSALLVSVCALIMLLARPARPIAVLLALTAVASPVVLLVPNGLGSNLERLPYICLPAAVVATASARRAVAIAVITPAVALCGWSAGHDLGVAQRPAAAIDYYDSLARRLDTLPQARGHRLEVVQSRSFHTAAYALLNHAALATGWETQAQQELDPVLASKRLSATAYRSWLDNNAVGLVAFDRRTPGSDPEYRLVRHGLPYLRALWRDPTWTLYAVIRPVPIVARPAALLSAGQAALRLRVPCACRIRIRVRWSRFLDLVPVGPGHAGAVAPAAGGWTWVSTPAPGAYELTGRY